MNTRIHVIDPDYRRRAQIAHELSAWGNHTEIYEDLAEFGERRVTGGCIFAVDGEDGFDPREIVDLVRARGLALPLVMYSDRASPDVVVSAMLCGALDYLQFPFEPANLRATFQRLSGEGARRAHREGLRARAMAKVATLSRRERAVLVGLVQGLSNKEIALNLHLSPRTVEIHRGNMLRKLEAQSSVDAVRIGLYAELDDDFRIAA